jgi:hypothetical protein
VTDGKKEWHECDRERMARGYRIPTVLDWMSLETDKALVAYDFSCSLQGLKDWKMSIEVVMQDPVYVVYRLPMVQITETWQKHFAAIYSPQRIKREYKWFVIFRLRIEQWHHGKRASTYFKWFSANR